MFENKDLVKRHLSNFITWDVTNDDLDKKIQLKKQLEYFASIGLNVEENKAVLLFVSKVARSTQETFTRHFSPNNPIFDSVCAKLKELQNTDVKTKYKYHFDIRTHLVLGHSRKESDFTFTMRTPL
jgi:hypothetical protein